MLAFEGVLGWLGCGYSCWFLGFGLVGAPVYTTCVLRALAADALYGIFFPMFREKEKKKKKSHSH
jgi:hypothetical protein